MKKYQYKFVEVKVRSGLNTKAGDTFSTCKQIIQEQADAGWRLKQVLTPINEKSGVNAPLCYQIIFEQEL